VILTLLVPFDVQQLSKNQRLHWRERARRVKTAREAARLAWLQAGSPVSEVPLCVALTICRPRALDPTNALSGWYACEDALFNHRANGYGITPDDSARWLSYEPVRFATGARWRGRAEVRVTMTPREEDGCQRTCG
jgi:hypothetical protein